MEGRGEDLIRAATRVVERLREAGHEAYFAGGAVRDQLLGIAPHDVDIATSAHPDAVQMLFPRVTDIQGKAFGVVRVLEEDRVFEIATFRKDGAYGDGRRPDSVAFATAQEDAQRRDFTVNGLFWDPLEQRVIDWVGGVEDLRARRLRAIGTAGDRFNEDHLRLFRAVRFATQLDFELEPETWKGVCAHAHLASRLAPERVRDELVKCFCGPDPGRALDLLDQAGLLHHWIPEVAEMKGVDQPPEYHPEGDVYTHVRLMMGMLKNADPVVAFSVLLHDIAKPDTRTVDESGRIRFNGHESVGARKAEEIMRRLRFSNQMIEAVSECVAGHMKFKDSLSMKLSTLKRFLARPHFEHEMELHRIDCLGCHQDLSIYEFLRIKQEEFSKQPLLPEPLVKGEDLIAMGIKPGPEMGKILRQLQDEQLEGLIHDRETALSRAREWWRALSGN